MEPALRSLDGSAASRVRERKCTQVKASWNNAANRCRISVTHDTTRWLDLSLLPNMVRFAVRALACTLCSLMQHRARPVRGHRHPRVYRSSVGSAGQQLHPRWGAPFSDACSSYPPSNSWLVPLKLHAALTGEGAARLGTGGQTLMLCHDNDSDCRCRSVCLVAASLAAVHRM